MSLLGPDGLKSRQKEKKNIVPKHQKETEREDVKSRALRYFVEGRSEDAERLYRRLTWPYQDVDGKIVLIAGTRRWLLDDLTTLENWTFLARILCDQQKFGEAEAILHQLLHDRQAISDHFSSDILSSDPDTSARATARLADARQEMHHLYVALGWILVRQRKFEVVGALADKWFGEYLLDHGSDNKWVLLHLAGFLSQNSTYSKAEGILRYAVSAQGQLEETELHLAHSMLGRVLNGQQRWSEAEQALLKSADYHWENVAHEINRIKWLSTSLFGQKRYQEAESQCLGTLRLFKEAQSSMRTSVKIAEQLERDTVYFEELLEQILEEKSKIAQLLPSSQLDSNTDTPVLSYGQDFQDVSKATEPIYRRGVVLPEPFPRFSDEDHTLDGSNLDPSEPEATADTTIQGPDTTSNLSNISYGNHPHNQNWGPLEVQSPTRSTPSQIVEGSPWQSLNPAASTQPRMATSPNPATYSLPVHTSTFPALSVLSKPRSSDDEISEPFEPFEPFPEPGVTSLLPISPLITLASGFLPQTQMPAQKSTFNVSSRPVDSITEAANSQLTKFFQENVATTPLTDAQILHISSLLKYADTVYEKVPRTYTVLRQMNCLHLLDDVISSGFSDFHFPAIASNVPPCLTLAQRISFLKSQDLVLTSSLELERGGHLYFGSVEDVPLTRDSILGTGGFGEVDKVLSLTTFKEYARKRVPRNMVFASRRQGEMVTQLVAEINILKRLKHPHVVNMIGSYTDPRYMGLIMTPIADIDLSTYLATASPSSHHELRTFFGCLAYALKYLHEQSLRHKDIKPSNVLVYRGSVLFTDFGLSFDYSDGKESTTVSMVNGMTKRYCAPEVAESQPRNILTDIWSLGIVFLEMLVTLKGRTVESMREYFQQHGTKEEFIRDNHATLGQYMDFLKSIGRESDNFMVDWILSMLEMTKENRPTAAHLVDSMAGAPRVEDAPRFCGLCCSVPNGWH
jgi:predicted negative regulator of RcsB-dependent stress response